MTTPGLQLKFLVDNQISDVQDKEKLQTHPKEFGFGRDSVIIVMLENLKPNMNCA